MTYSSSVVPRFIRYEDSLIEGPAIEPIDLDQTKLALRFTATSEDTLIDTDISAARLEFEQYTGRQLIAATWERWLECFPLYELELPKAPLLSVTSVTYDSGDGDVVLVEGTDYYVANPQGPQARQGYLCPVTTWPTAAVAGPKSVRVRYVAGYGYVTGDVPELAKKHLMLLAGDYFKYRTRTVETTNSQAFSELPHVRPVLVNYKIESRYPPVRW